MMPQLTFEEAWQALQQLEGKTIPTLVYKYRSRVVGFTPTKMVRQIEMPGGNGWKAPSSVDKGTFKRIWGHLRQYGFYDGKGSFAIACLVEVPELNVEYVEGKVPRTIVLKSRQSASGANAEMNNEDRETNDFGDSDRIVVDSEICSGKPTIRGTRIMVSNILGMFAGDYTMDRILRAYPELSFLDVTSALEYASWVVDREKIIASG